MPRITEELVRKRAEHNNGEITTLEELSLHQQDLERIEHLDRWCCHLKILYLQNNLIPRIENVSRLKELQYLNLALNNVEKIENLEGCEFLQKLDFTVNFIGDLLSVEKLGCNVHLQELYLTGNPCTEYDGYRDFVIASLPQLLTLDGKEITKSERISATQQLNSLRKLVTQEQKEYALKREREKEAFKEKHCGEKVGGGAKERQPGFDRRWYTDPEAHVSKEGQTEEGKKEDSEEEEEAEAYTPEYRLKNHRDMLKKKMKEAKEPENKLEMPKRVRTLEKNGKMLNVNEGKYNFHLKDEGSHYVLEVECPRYMDTSLIDCDIQTTYVRLNIKTKILQLVLEEEVSPDSSTAKRSQTTGHLLLTLPKTKPLLRPLSTTVPHKKTVPKETVIKVTLPQKKAVHGGQPKSKVINTKCALETDTAKTRTENTDTVPFEDDPTVPPLI